MTSPGLPRQSLTLELPLTPQYTDENVSLAKQTIMATLDLGGGPRSFQSQPKTVGTYNGVEIKAKLNFDYEYDKNEDKLTIRGNDDRTPRQLCITTMLGGHPGLTSKNAPGLAFRHTPNDAGLNHLSFDMWTDHVGRHPGFSGAVTETARTCNQAITTAAIDAGISSVLELGTPPIVNLENLDDFKQMFGEPITATAPIGKIADVARMQIKVDSTYVGTVTWQKNATFANVIGSTQDPKPSGVTSWLELWANKCNSGHDTTECSSKNFFSKDTSWVCTTEFVGGHVITGTVAKSMSKGSTVYIFPICSRHNGSDPNYMKSIYNPKGVQLSYW